MPARNLDIHDLRMSRHDWMKVCEDNLKDDIKIKYQNRKKAVDLYIDGYSLKEIMKTTNIHESRISYYVKKCMTINPDTNAFYGYSALIPQKRTKKYQRTKNDSVSSSGLSGAFGQLMLKYPTLPKLIYNNYFRKDKSTLEKIIKVK